MKNLQRKLNQDRMTPQRDTMHSLDAQPTSI